MKIVIYGAGDFGMMLCSQIAKEQNHLDESDIIVAVVDADPKVQGLCLFEKYTVLAPEKIANLEYDCIMISLADENAKKAIIYKLAQLGVPFEKIRFENIVFKTMFGGFVNDDYNAQRYEIAREFRNLDIPGNIAECGVFRGEFAKRLNRLFYDKKLYLFDTFEGFDDDDLKKENERLNSRKFSQWLDAPKDMSPDVFCDTSVSYVMSIMPFPDKVTIRKGFVPDTLIGIDDSFSFVSLDMDIYEPMFESLKFFWDKMTKGGMLLLHDYYNLRLPGVKLAVKDFEQLLGAKVAKFPTRDVSSLAIIKN